MEATITTRRPHAVVAGDEVRTNGRVVRVSRIVNDRCFAVEPLGNRKMRRAERSKKGRKRGY